ncbi:hypothetical protein [Neisseria sp. 83E34]|uniref:hypothetical protein n=1 Tax=Neisseria sp. 83E34 TaxID=1692264 RepID=UPI0006CEA8AD|nr:hypothetical protein [Neisseria sp. 83E34]KPN72613.1 hypothetical protein AKG09_01915 [Neisseria sp. 83E34]
MNIRFTVSALVAVAALSGCAQLNAGLEQLSGALDKANSALSASNSSGSIGKTYTVVDKVTSQYEIRNLSLKLEKLNETRTDVRFDGQAFNKTNKLLNISIVIPVYDEQNYLVTSVRAQVHLPPGEKTRVDTVSPFALRDGHHLNTRKTRFVVAEY